MKLEFSVDDDGALWLTYAHDISARFKKSGFSQEHLRQIGLLNEEEPQGDHDVTQSKNRHLDLTRDYLDKPHKASKKMLCLMSDHYYDLKVKLGLVGVHEEEDDILNDPVPYEEQFPSVVIKKMEIDRANKIKKDKKFTIKSKEELEEQENQLVNIKQLPRGFKPHLISRETKLLAHNLQGVDPRTLADDKNFKFIRHTDPSSQNKIEKNSKALQLSKLYQPPLKHYEIPSNNPFCTRSFTIAQSFQTKRKNKGNLSGRVAGRSLRRFNDDSGNYNIDWTKVSGLFVRLINVELLPA